MHAMGADPARWPGAEPPAQGAPALWGTTPCPGCPSVKDESRVVVVVVVVVVVYPFHHHHEHPTNATTTITTTIHIQTVVMVVLLLFVVAASTVASGSGCGARSPSLHGQM